MKTLTMSSIPKTWLIDIDGVIFVHNSYLREDGDTLLPDIQVVFSQISNEDCIILLTSRTIQYYDTTIKSLKKFNIKFNHIIFGLPFGERILINDKKLSNLKTAFAVNTLRDNPGIIRVIRDPLL